MGSLASRRQLLISVAVIAVVLACGWFVVVRLNVLAPTLCFAPPDQAAMIDKFKDDPLYSVTPEGGRLTYEKAMSYECDNGHGGSPTTPRFATVTKRYTTSTTYTLVLLDKQYASTAIAAGWLGVAGKNQYLLYCKRFGDRAADALVLVTPTGTGSQVEITLDAGAKGSTCK